MGIHVMHAISMDVLTVKIRVADSGAMNVRLVSIPLTIRIVWNANQGSLAA